MYGTQVYDPKLQPKLNNDTSNIKRGEVLWPVDSRSLQALVDLGLSDQKIAEYFHVSVANVTETKARYASRLTANTK